MKNLFYVVLVLSTMYSCTLNKQVPNKVVKTFNQKFQSATKVKWAKENKTEWEVKFEILKKSMSANFNLNGKWLETETKIAKKDMPVRIMNIVTGIYKKYKIIETGFVETTNYKAFEIEINKANKTLELIIDGSGKIIETRTIDKD